MIKIRFVNNFMVKNSFNPFKLWGSYAGVLLGAYVYYKEINPFPFLRNFLGFLDNRGIEFNIALGFFAGYALHLFIRSFINGAKNKTKNSLSKESDLYGGK